jgi:hypothetical protein
MRTLALLLFAVLLLLPNALAKAPLSAREIVMRAHEAAGGALWLRPKTLHLRGSAVLYQDGLQHAVRRADHYEMWRVFPAFNLHAHDANGKVRIDAKNAGQIIFQTAFDGQRSYNQHGELPSQSAQSEWREAFGFGIIRFALAPEMTLTRLADDTVDAALCFVVRVRDAAASDTIFWIDQASAQIRKVGFDTPKGWHERVYSDFFTLANGWVQPGRVRLTYRGALSNDIRWSYAAVNEKIDDQIFVISADRAQPAPASKAP